jgi:ectoine hydroxylase-related dioxygenase (phytanoyl-CoA dioxygenase family)
LNVMWPLTPFRESNGATLLWPDSHGLAALKDGDPGKPVATECDPGDAVLFLGSTLHGAGGNREASSRRAILISYCLGWLKPYENQWLAYPPEIARHFSPDLASLVGYQQHRPNLGNYEGQCPSILLRERSGPSGAVDALRPDQAALLADYVAQQRQELLRPSGSQ